MAGFSVLQRTVTYSLVLGMTRASVGSAISMTYVMVVSILKATTNMLQQVLSHTILVVGVQLPSKHTNQAAVQVVAEL